MAPTLVLITGAPATGKSTLATQLAYELGWPLISRDRIREMLWDALPTSDAGPHETVQLAQWPMFYALVGDLLGAGTNVIAESAVHHVRAVNELQPLVVLSKTVLIHCETTREIVCHRFLARAASGTRHISHDNLDQAARLVQDPGRWAHFEEPPDLGVPLLRVETTNRLQPDLGTILTFIRGKTRL